jgi:hypothetical protein
MGNSDMKEIKAGAMDPAGEQLTNIGRILGIVGTVLMILGLGLAILMLMFGILAGAAGQ